MATESTKRIAFGIDQDAQNKLQSLKKSKFFDVSWSTMYRIVMAEGIKAVKEK